MKMFIPQAKKFIFKHFNCDNYHTAEQDVGSWQILALQVERQEFHASSSPSDMFPEDFPNKTEDNLVNIEYN